MSNPTTRTSATIDLRDMIRRMPEEQRRRLWAESMGGEAYPFAAKPLEAPPDRADHPPFETVGVAPVRDVITLPSADYTLRGVGVHVTCVMPLYTTHLAKAALQGVKSFLAQTHPFKNLVVVNSTPTPLLSGSTEGVREVGVPSTMSIGAMRNVGWEHTPKNNRGWLCQWDANCWNHPLRLAYQAAFASGPDHKYPVLLARETRLNLHTSTMFVHDDPLGIAGTALLPPLLRPEDKYPDTSDREDLRLLAVWGRQRVVADNPEGAAASLVTSFYVRGQIATPESDWMGRYDGPQFERKNHVAAGLDFQTVCWATAVYGFSVSSQEAARPVTSVPGVSRVI